MKNFETWIEKLGKREGVYSDSRHDWGGETFCGVARKRRPGWKGWPRVDQLKAGGRVRSFKTWAEVQAAEPALFGLVIETAQSDYWEASGAARFTDEPAWAEFQDAVADGAFNQGPGFAADCIQHAVNALNKAGRLCPNLVVDGGIGPKTVAAVEAIFEADGGAYYLTRAVRFFRERRYFALAEKSEEQELNLRSWLRRAGGQV